MREQESQSTTEALATELLAVLTKVEQGEQAASERWERQGQKWEQAQRVWVERAGSQIARLAEVADEHARQAETLARLSQRLDHQSAPWVWGWSRREWKGLLLAVILSVLGTMLYYEAGPPAQGRAWMEKDYAILKNLWWNKATEAHRAQILSQDAAPQE